MEKLIKIAEKLGIENRIDQTNEECAELIQALCKYKRVTNGDKTCKLDLPHAEYKVAEELADVNICINQIMWLLGNEEQVQEIIDEKLQRTIELLEKEE